MNTDPIKAKIQELLPDTKWEWQEHDYKDGFDYTAQAPITLAVVLRAIDISDQRTNPIVVDTHGCFMELIENRFIASPTPHWNLEHDNYDDQTRETQLFIGKLLGV